MDRGGGKSRESWRYGVGPGLFPSRIPFRRGPPPFLRDTERAKAFYKRAWETSGGTWGLEARFNFALLCEETGNRAQKLESLVHLVAKKYLPALVWLSEILLACSDLPATASMQEREECRKRGMELRFQASLQDHPEALYSIESADSELERNSVPADDLDRFLNKTLESSIMIG